MPSMLESMMNQIGTQDITQLSRAVGADEDATRNGLAAALPMILAGLAKNASRPEGAAELDQALAKDHDGALLDQLSGFLGQGDSGPGDAILRHVFGDRKKVVADGISRTGGLDAGQAAKLLAMAAPVVMAVLGRQRRQKQLDPESLGSMLREENREVQQTAPQLGALARLLDADNDGSIADDVIGGLGKLFGGGRSRGPT